MGTGAVAVNTGITNYQKNSQAYNLYGESQQELVTEALELDPDNAYAQKLQLKLDSDKQLSGAQLRKLAAQNEAVIQSAEAQNQTSQNVTQPNATTPAAKDQINATVNQKDVAKMLLGKGFYTQKVSGVAEAITARLNGQELTRTQKSILSSALNSSTVRDTISEFLKKKTNGIDKPQNNVYDDSDIRDGFAGEEKTASQNLSEQRADVFSGHDHIASAESTPVDQPQNALADGVVENDTAATDSIITDGSHLEKGKLKPNVTYKTGEHDYFYTTNEDGLIVNARTDDLQWKNHEGRFDHNPNTYGKKTGDHAGHLFGDRFGGSPELDNLVSQAKNVNLSEYRRIENRWAKALKNGQKVTVSIDIHYNAGGVRPISFVVSYTIDGVRHRKVIKNQ